ncbi:MAG: VanZ family protein, partial [Clostridiaceae bacterium]
MKKRIFKWILVIAFMVLIFMFSNEVAVESDEKSKFVINILNMLGIDLNSAFGNLADFLVRKAAHFTEYFLLFLLLYNALAEDFSVKAAINLAILFVFLYACTDEYHQLFIEGRSGKFRDVLIDTSGGFLCYIIIALKNKKKKKNKKDNIWTYSM